MQPHEPTNRIALGRPAAIVLALAGLAAAFAPSPAYRRYRLWELAAYADGIATGEIVRVDAQTFGFRVDEALLGTQAATTLTVKRFEDWTCHGRWTGYAVGQRLMVFLCRDKDEPDKLHVMGGGDEGELPFVGESVVAENTQSYGVRGFEVGLHHPAGAPMQGTSLPAAELAAAVLGFRESFVWNHEREIGPRASLEQAQAYASSSRIARHLFEEASSSRGWTGPIAHLPEPLEASALPHIVAREFPPATTDRWSLPEMTRSRTAGYSSRFGESLALPGDLDGDGNADLLVGAPYDRDSGNAHGAAWLLFLDASGQVQGAAELRDLHARLLPPMNEFARFGSAVAALGDLDGNSIPDLAVGAPGWDGVQEGRGGLWVLFMGRGGTVVRAVEVAGSSVLDELGVGEGSGLGASIALLGDLEDDGTVEVAIGQDPGFDLAFEHGRSVFLVSLAADGSAQRARRIHGREDGFDGGSGFGESLCAIGDVDGDGSTDLAIGAPGDDDGGNGRGAVWVMFLAPDGSPHGRRKLSDWAGGFEGRLVDGSRFGSALSAPGDLDGDGVPDLLVGAANGLWCLRLDRDGTVREQAGVQLAERAGEGTWRFGRSVATGPASILDAKPVVAVGGRLARRTDSIEAIWWLALDQGRLVPRRQDWPR